MNDLKGQEYEMFDFFERTPVLVCIAGKDGYFKKVNPAVIERFGYTEEELLARPISSFIYHEDKDRTNRERLQLLTGKALVNFQNRYTTKKGELIWLEWTSIYFSDKELVFAIANDVTLKKQSEKEIEEKYIKFKSLATHFKTSIEKDRKYLAIELHEELAQLASVVKMELDVVLANLPKSKTALKGRLSHALAVSGVLINTIRRISFSLSPQMLEDHGLKETLKWQCGEFSLLTGINCAFESNYDDDLLPPEIQLDFFRICQQALNNIMHHAQAKQVYVDLQENEKEICLFIQDDGIGFDVNEENQNIKLNGMRERATSANGKFIIESEQGKGTKVCFSVTK